MRWKRFKAWNSTSSLQPALSSGTTASVSEAQRNSLVVSDLTQRLLAKDAQIDALSSRVSELAGQLSLPQPEVGSAFASAKPFKTAQRISNAGNADPAGCSDSASLDLHSVVSSCLTADFQDAPMETSSVNKRPSSGTNKKSVSQTSLLDIYEKANIQLLEKLKVRESENQALVKRISQLTERLLSVETQLASADQQLLQESKGSRPVDPKKLCNVLYSAFETMQKTLAYKYSLDSISIAGSTNLALRSDESCDDAKSFINKLFDAIPSMSLEPGDNCDLNSKTSSSTLDTSVSSINGNDTTVTSVDALSCPSKDTSYRRSCDSLLSLNKSAIKSHADLNEPTKSPVNGLKTNLKSKSPSTRQIRSFTTSSKKKVQQLSLYLSPSKEFNNINYSSSPTNISSPISTRSSVIFNEDLDLSHLSTPATPQTPCFSDFGDIKPSYPSGNFSSNASTRSNSPTLCNSPTFSTISSITSNVSCKKLSFANALPTDTIQKAPCQSIKKMKTERNFSPVSMDIIEEAN